jgi:small subunit ribosomal protein S1
METKPQGAAEAEAYVPPPEDDEAAGEASKAEGAKAGSGLPQENQIVPATVLRVTGLAAVVDFGWKSEGQVSITEFDKVDGVPAVKPGDKLEVLVESLPDDSGKLVLSKEKAEKVRLWDSVVAKCAHGGPVQGLVVARVGGGYSVDIGVRAFLPSAQADLRRLGNPDSLVGAVLEFGVTQFDKRRGNIVLTRRALLEKELGQKKQETMTRLAEGAILPGVVKTLTDYGAFIDLGGIDGLLHVSELGWARVGHVREVLKVGQEVTVKVLKFDAATGKIGLSLKQLQDDPWQHAAEKYKPGTQVKGRVAGFADFGAFIALEPGIEGLVHISEMSWTRRVKHPSKELDLGAEVQALVLDVDAKARRLALGMRQLQANPWTVLEEQYPIGTVIKTTVRSVTDFGVFLEVLEGIDGLVHVSDLSWTQRVKHPSELFKKGDAVEAVVLNVDVENERFSLGIKQLRPDPWTELAQKHPIGSKLTGKVTRVADFGAFVEIEPGIEGLVHVSELREERVENPGDVVKSGESIEVQVLDIDAHERKVSLSVRALTYQPDDYRKFMDQDAGKARLGDVFPKVKG